MQRQPQMQPEISTSEAYEVRDRAQMEVRMVICLLMEKRTIGRNASRVSWKRKRKWMDPH
jgi:hypothetical protein